MMLQHNRRAFLCESSRHKQGGKGWRDSKIERNKEIPYSLLVVLSPKL